MVKLEIMPCVSPFKLVLPNHSILGKFVILHYLSSGTEVPDDEYYDEDDHNEVVQYLLDVVDEEAQNLLNQNNVTSEAQSLLHLKKAASENHLPGNARH